MFLVRIEFIDYTECPLTHSIVICITFRNLPETTSQFLRTVIAQGYFLPRQGKSIVHLFSCTTHIPPDDQRTTEHSLWHTQAKTFHGRSHHYGISIAHQGLNVRASTQEGHILFKPLTFQLAYQTCPKGLIGNASRNLQRKYRPACLLLQVRIQAISIHHLIHTLTRMHHSHEKKIPERFLPWKLSLMRMHSIVDDTRGRSSFKMEIPLHRFRDANGIGIRTLHSTDESFACRKLTFAELAYVLHMGHAQTASDPPAKVEQAYIGVYQLYALPLEHLCQTNLRNVIDAKCGKKARQEEKFLTPSPTVGIGMHTESH